MARLQILELPEGAGDDRPPFVLVVDQITEDETEAFLQSDDATNGFAAKVGARAVVTFHGVTIDIPANEPPPMAEVVEDPERAGTTQLVYAHERTRLDLCSALLVSGDTTWRKLVETVRERQRELADALRKLDRVLSLPEQPEARDARRPHSHEYLLGYSHAMDAAKRAAQNEPTAKNGG